MILEERLTDPESADPIKISDIHSNGGSQNLMNTQRRRTAATFRESSMRANSILSIALGFAVWQTDVLMLKLGVNIDHVATVREARYRGRHVGEPDPVAAALQCEGAGAHGITAHLREDRRHIQDRDVWRLREVIQTRLNLEMANAPEIVAVALKLKPDIVCLVPERRQEVTTEGGLDVAGNRVALSETTQRMKAAGIEVSLFIAPDAAQVEAAAKTGAQFIELHTGTFAERFGELQAREAELQRLIVAATQAHSLGLRVNAGHGLNYENLATLQRVPHLVELNIGHSIVSRAVSVGMTQAVKEMLKAMGGYQG
jgi:pyridoxine 5-phosphate synthase